MQQNRLEQPLVHGRLRLGFAYDRASQRTRLITHEQQPPLQAIRAFPLDNGGALLHLHNLSGGILGGDLHTIDVEVGEQARVQLTSTGATRLYRCRTNAPPAQQVCTMRVREGGLLEYLPDPLIPFAQARYQQETRIELAHDAGLFWWEMVAPGRSARGEIFAYDLLQIKLAISVNGRPIALEQFRLEPQCRPLTSVARLGTYGYFSSFYICRAGLPAPQWLELEEALRNLAQYMSISGTIIWGVSMLTAHGLVVRALSQQGRAIAQGLLAFWQTAKQALYGEAAVLPRKIY